MSQTALSILILGASYGLLPGVKLLLAGHRVTFVGKAQEIEALRASALTVRIPLRRSDDLVTLRAGGAGFVTPETALPEAADMVILATQEPHFGSPDLLSLMRRIAAARKPCLSIMNLPPPPFLARLGISGEALAGVYTSSAAWEPFDPALVSNASPDPQALRFDPARPGELTVTLASNFKAAPFAGRTEQMLLERIARDLSRVVIDGPSGPVAPPVKLLAHSSPWIALAKWPMLIAGNCRCLAPDATRTIAEAVLSDMEQSAAIYDAVGQLVRALGAPDNILVPFGAYASAAAQLARPSSLARALDGGAVAVERIDLLVAQLMREAGLDTGPVLPIVQRIEARLEHNRRAASSASGKSQPVTARSG